MKTKYFKTCISFLLLCVGVQCSAQFSKVWKGKVVSENSDLDGIYVLNLKNLKSATTAKGGYFEIKGAIGDTLQFSAIQFKSLKFALRQQDFDSDLFFIKLETAVTTLDEVKINQYKNINAVSLGILMKPAKQYTAAERRLFAATSGGGIDGLLNLISGRTKMLKQQLAVEKKESSIEKITSILDVKYFVETLKIPSEKVKAFQYYCAEDANFISVLKSKNKTMAKFMLVDLARNYLKLQTQNE